MSFRARPPVRRLAATVSVVGLSLLGVVTSPASPGAASTADEGALVSLVNGARSAAGLPALAVSGALSATARSHSAAMAAAGSLFHSGNLAGTIGDSVAGWVNVAENVAVAGSVTEAHQALLGSSEHRAHILGDFTLLGVGVVQGGDGRVWVTEHFAKVAVAPAPEPAPVVEEPAPVVQAMAVEAAAPPAPAPAPAPEPKPRAGRVRSTTRVAATAMPTAVGDDVSCLPPQAKGQGHAYGRCADGPAAASGGHGRPGRGR